MFSKTKNYEYTKTFKCFIWLFKKKLYFKNMTTQNYYYFHLLGKPAGELEWKTTSGLKYQQLR